MPSDHQSSAAGARSDKESTILLRKLGSSAVPTYLERVIQEDGAAEFVVAERLPRGAMSDEEVAECVHDARLAANLEHPNVVRTRAVRVGSDDIDVITNYVAGERLSELWTSPAGPAKAIPFDIALHVLIDVATGLGALHKLRSEENHERVKYVHGEVTPANVLVGLDGVSAILRAARVRLKDEPATVRPGAVAPEVLAGGPLDQRTDIYAMGALLWELISGRPPSPDEDVETMLANARRGPVARAIMRAAPWALGLGEVAARALDPAPEKRFPTAASMITELRKIAGQRLATTEQVAKFVEATAGEKIAARLQDVQASAVIRKATSIPPPRSVAPKRLSKPSTKPVDSVPVSSVAPTRQYLPRIEAPPASTPEPPTVARPRVLAAASAPPAQPSARPAAPPVPPPAPSARPVAPPGVAVAAPALPALVEPPKKSPAKPALPPARAPSPSRRKAPSSASTPSLRSRLLQPALLRLVGAAFAIAMVTAVLAWRAVRNRQAIVAPGAVMEMPAAPAPVVPTASPPVAPPAPAAVAPASPPPVAKAPTPAPAPATAPVVAPARAEATSSTNSAVAPKVLGAKPSEPRKAASTKSRKK